MSNNRETTEEAPAPKALSFPEGMPPHQIEAIKKGGSAHFQGEVYTLENLGFHPSMATGAAVDLSVRVAELEAENAALRKQLAKATKQTNEVSTPPTPKAKEATESTEAKKVAEPKKAEPEKAEPEKVQDDLAGKPLKELRPIAEGLGIDVPAVGASADGVRDQIRAKRAEKPEGQE